MSTLTLWKIWRISADRVRPLKSACKGALGAAAWLLFSFFSPLSRAIIAPLSGPLKTKQQDALWGSLPTDHSYKSSSLAVSAEESSPILPMEVLKFLISCCFNCREFSPPHVGYRKSFAISWWSKPIYKSVPVPTPYPSMTFPTVGCIIVCSEYI